MFVNKFHDNDGSDGGKGHTVSISNFFWEDLDEQIGC